MNPAPVRMLLMGPPGSGKGTQASRTASLFGIPAISTGDIFRANVAAMTPLGRRAQQYMDAGEYVPDALTNDMVRARLDQDDASDGWLLDGFPRTLDQARQLDLMASAQGGRVDVVVALAVDEDELVTRLTARAATEGRSDDTESVIRRRQAVFREQTQPLLELYGERGVLVSVSGRGSVGDVQQSIARAVGQLQANSA